MFVKFAVKREKISCCTALVSCAGDALFPRGGRYSAWGGKRDGRYAETTKYFQKPVDKMTEYLHNCGKDDIIAFTIFL
jgi:hypothetical protein